MPKISEFSPKKQGHSFSFSKASRGGLPLFPCSLSLPTCFKIFMSPSENLLAMPLKFPEYMWALFWIESEMQLFQKDKFCQRTYATFKNSKHIYLFESWK